MMSLTIRKTILVPENYHDILEYYNKNKPRSFHQLETRFEGGFGFKVYCYDTDTYLLLEWKKQTIYLNINNTFIDIDTFYNSFCHAFGEKYVILKKII